MILLPGIMGIVLNTMQDFDIDLQLGKVQTVMSFLQQKLLLFSGLRLSTFPDGGCANHFTMLQINIYWTSIDETVDWPLDSEARDGIEETPENWMKMKMGKGMGIGHWA